MILVISRVFMFQYLPHGAGKHISSKISFRNSVTDTSEFLEISRNLRYYMHSDIIIIIISIYIALYRALLKALLLKTNAILFKKKNDRMAEVCCCPQICILFCTAFCWIEKIHGLVLYLCQKYAKDVLVLVFFTRLNDLD